MCKRVLLLPIHCDVNCSCGLCWTLMWRGCFFFFPFHVQMLSDGIHEHGNLHSCHLFLFMSSTLLPFLFLPLVFSKCPLLFPSPLLCSPLFCFSSCSVGPFLPFCFFPFPASLALPLGRGGTVMFMKPFNVLCNYPGNTSHHYSCQ